MATGWDLKKPCVDCPFLSSNIERFGFTYDRALELAEVVQESTFNCHKTVDFKQDEEGESYQSKTPKTQVCAGSLIAMERDESSSQMMRIAERLGFYDRTKLDMSADVEELEDWIAAHE